MIGFHNVRFPENVSWRSSGGPEFKTQVFEAFRGGEKRNIEWSQPLMRFNVAYGVKTDTQMLDVINFFNARQGRAYGFRYKNWGNYKIEDAPIATGDGYSTRLPLWKFYGFPQARMYKRLRKIVRGSVKNVNVLGNPMVEGVDFNINYDTGEIALNDAPGYGIPVYGYLEFDEPVRFDVDSIQAAIDQYNSQSLNRLELVGVKAGFTENSVFAPNEDASGDDEFFESVRLVLNFDDTDVLTDTVDQSELAVPVSFNGDASLTTSEWKHGSGSFFAGDTGYLSLTGIPYGLASLPFTLEFFATVPTTGAEEQTIIGKWAETGSDRCWTVRYIKSTSQLRFVISTDGTAETVVLNYPWAANSGGLFDYITIDRMSSGWYVLRINGKVVQQARNTSTVYNTTTPLVIGRIPSVGAGQGPFQGYIDSIRFTIGRNRNVGFDTIDIPTPYPV